MSWAKSDLDAIKRPLPNEEVWTTFIETAALLRRSPKTIKNLVYKHELPRRIIKHGGAGRRIALLSYRTRERLREICWGPDSL
jgi:hypothetical protein